DLGEGDDIVEPELPRGERCCGRVGGRVCGDGANREGGAVEAGEVAGDLLVVGGADDGGAGYRWEKRQGKNKREGDSSPSPSGRGWRVRPPGEGVGGGCVCNLGLQGLAHIQSRGLIRTRFR